MVIILGIIAGIAVPSFGPAMAHLELKETTNNIAYLMRYAQSKAVVQNTVYSIIIDRGQKKYWLARADDDADENDTQSFKKITGRLGRIFGIPDHIEIEMPKEFVLFYPEGRIEKLKIFLTNRGNQTYTIATDQQINRILVFDLRLD